MTYTISPKWESDTISALSVGEILWDFDMLKILAIWSNYKVQGEGVNAYVIDTGIDSMHIGFAHKPAALLSCVPSEKDPQDFNGHGTWCCGKIAAQGVGLAPNSNLTSIKVLNANGEGSDEDICKALEYVLNQPKPHIVNMSLGGYNYDRRMDHLCSALWDKGCIVVAAAGNENTDQLSYPAAFKNVLAVAAIEKSTERADFSNYGQYVSVAAPGVTCYSTYPAGYRKLSGTSMAAPTVAGVLTLGFSYIFKHKPKIAAARARDLVMSAIKTTTIDLGSPGYDYYYGFGGINADSFLAYIVKYL